MDSQKSYEVPTRELEFLSTGIVRWSVENGRRFRWREPKLDHYQLIVTELFLQRTRAETVAAFEDKFFERFPTWESITKTPESDLKEALKPIGLYKRRASVLARLAKEMVQLSGVVPIEREKIEALPGVGQYIANAIELLVFGKPLPLLDGGMARVLERFVHPRLLADIRYDPWLQESAHYIVDTTEPTKVNWAILDFAALVCKPRNPSCYECPVSTGCTYFSSSQSTAKL